MADVDKIGKISRRWLKMYKKVCEGHFDSVSLANDAMKPLQKDIEKYGKSPVRFLIEASNRLEEINNKPLFLRIHSWNEEDQFIYDLKLAYMKKYRPNKRGMSIAVSAYKDIVHRFRNDEYLVENIKEALIRSYIRRIYDSSFADLVPATLEDHWDVNREEISQRLGEISVYVDENIDFLASQIARKGYVGRLRLSQRSSPQKSISIMDDVFSIGNNQ